MKYKAWLTGLLLVPFMALTAKNSQTDSLKHVVQSDQADTARLEALIKLTNIYKGRYPDTAIHYGHKAVQLGKQLKERYEAQCYLNYGLAYLFKGQLDSTEKYWQQGKRVARRAGMEEKALDYTNNLAILHTQKGNWQQALSLYTKALKKADAISYQKRSQSIRTNLSILYIKKGLYKEALEMLYKAKDQALKKQNYKSAAIIFKNIGNVYQKNEQYGQSLDAIEKARRYYAKEGSPRDKLGTLFTKAQVLSSQGDEPLDTAIIRQSLKISMELADSFRHYGFNRFSHEAQYTIARNHRLLGQYNKALNYLQKSLKGRSQRKLARTNSYLGLSEAYRKTGQYTRAKTYADSAHELASELGSLSTKMAVNNAYSDIYKDMGDYKKALEYHKLFKEKKDSLYNQNKSEQIEALRIKYQTAAKEQENALLQKEVHLKDAEMAKSRALNRGMAAGGIAIVASFIAFFAVYKGRQKALWQARQFTLQELTLKQVSSALHSGMGSELNALILHLNNKLGETREVESLKTIYEKIRTTSHLLNLPDFSQSNLKDEISRLAAGFQTGSLQVETEFYSANNWKNVPVVASQNLYRMIQELLTNTIKHAEASKVTIELAHHSKRISLIYSDNGVGYDPNSIEHHNGFDMEINGRINTLGGRMEDESRPEEGMEIVINIPLAKIMHEVN